MSAPVTIHFDAPILRAFLKIAPSRETQYYLNGVAVQIRGGEGRLVCTDNHRLLIAAFSAPHEWEVDLIVPTAALKRALTGATKKTLSLPFRGSGREWKLGDVSFDPVEGTYPAWGRVFPDLTGEDTGKPAHFNANYVGDFGKVGDILDAPPVIHPNGNSPALVTFGERVDVLALLMPMRKESREIGELRALIDATRMPEPAKDKAA